ncbi:fibronectin type III domain-containing protein [Candidatus Microgenomates bacterium]|nr:fibronectin type III domain-containing protein [Candidatus Microgenomates bacterium]
MDEEEKEKKEEKAEHKPEHENREESNFSKSKYLLIAGAVILVVALWMGFKMITGMGVQYLVTLVDGPKEVVAGSITTFTWRVDGTPTTINMTTVYIGTASTPGTLDTKIKPSETTYTQFVPDFASGKYAIPLQFVGNIKMENPGTYYYRVYAPVGEKNYWSDEYSFEVK